MSVTVVPFTSSLGDFTVAHGVAGGPAFLPTIQLDSLGLVVFQSPVAYDGTNLYLNASAAGLTGFVIVTSAGSIAGSIARYDGSVRDIIGESLVGVEVAVLTQPAVTTTEPGSPLATIYSGSTTSTLTISGASWLAGTATIVVSSVPSELTVGSYIQVSSVSPSGYNGIVQVTAISGLNVSYLVATNPGTYSSGGSVRTAALPNPFLSDNLGNFFFYTVQGLVTVQIYGGTLQQQLVLPDQAITLGGTGVSSVGLVMPSEFSVTGSPVTTSGNITVTKANENANLVFAGPSTGAAAAPTFRALVAADLPAGAGTGTVTTFSAGALSPLFTSSTATPTTTPALSFALSNAAANEVLAGPTSGGSGAPTYRALVAADMPLPLMPTVSGCFIGPTGAASAPSWRAPYACTITKVYVYVVGGTNAVINAQHNGTDIIADFTCSTLGSWVDAGAITGVAAVIAGDTITLEIVSETGSPTSVTILVQMTRP